MYGEGTEVRVYWDIGCFAFRHLNAFELSGREESMLSICVICFALSLSQASFLSLLGPSSSSSCFIFVLTILFSPQVHTLPDAIFRTLGKTSFLHTYIHHTENSCGPVSFSWYIQFILARSALPINIPPLALVVRLSSFLATSALTAIPYEREYPPYPLQAFLVRLVCIVVYDKSTILVCRNEMFSCIGYCWYVGPLWSRHFFMITISREHVSAPVPST